MSRIYSIERRVIRKGDGWRVVKACKIDSEGGYNGHNYEYEVEHESGGWVLADLGEMMNIAGDLIDWMYEVSESMPKETDEPYENSRTGDKIT